MRGSKHIAPLFFNLIMLFGSAYPATTKLTTGMCAKLFPYSDDCSPSKHLGDSEYCNVFDDDGFLLGYAFAVPVTVHGKQLDLFVGVDENAVVSRVLFTPTQLADAEFLRQFKGKTAKDSFDLVEKPEDLIYLPAKIKPMVKHIGVSRSIAQAVKQVLERAEQLGK